MNVVYFAVQVFLLREVLLTQQEVLPGSCTFDTSTCGYTSHAQHDNWNINQQGHLITVESSSLRGQEKAVLVSPVLDHQDWSCVRLVYQIIGRGLLQLHLRPQGDNFDYTLWTANQSSDSWLIGSVDIPNSTVNYQILLDGQAEHGPSNSVAIFEVHIVPGYCLDCDFEEHHLCGYSNSWNPNINWYVGGSHTAAPQSNLFDHVSNSNRTGHFMYADSLYAKHFQEVAKLMSPVTNVPIAGCLSFFYHRDQERGNMFTLFTKDQLGHYEEIWRPDVYVTSGWTLVNVDMKAPQPLQLVFEAAFNSARGGYVSIDDISFSPEFCHADTEANVDPSIANCDFEDGLCLYYLERAESKVWRRVSITPNAYRVGDHTTGTGGMLLANTRFSSMPGYVGRLHGPFLPGNHKYCLRFYYLLHGFRKADNALVLYIYDENNVGQDKVWSLADSSSDVWTEVEITYIKPMVSKIVFVSICSNFWECGLVAIDDITVSLGHCGIKKGSLPGQCDFESGLCGFIQEKTQDQADWLRVRGNTPTSYTGPRGDHTTGVGYFMYMEASHLRPGNKAHLRTWDLRGSSGPHCLIFYYHMYGSGTGILRVLLRRGDIEGDTLLWRRRGEQSVSWMRATVDYHCHLRHQIVFEAIRGPSLRSDIAIDDVRFKSAPCEDPDDIISSSGSSEYFNEYFNEV
ncbi:MAM domain-containing protein 2a isoform X2 [Dunckerocampus dactyliophorus]|uniref:MAM domain-containing protein 2a isoform X2 n=1 Tax=Dunckerocampus dactyliophorus TaxID=161453 RepID=UPI002404DA0C|nr:MAM domain-containing protein 2a isoform X2 [Dunckerocampus dactyliophorus]